jgi:predicted PhzF superfamily epimerase YddE/YHI9
MELFPPKQLCTSSKAWKCSGPSQIFVRADKRGEKIANVRVGGHAVEITQGEVTR